MVISISSPRFPNLPHLSLKGLRELLDVVLEGAAVGEELDVGTVDLDVTSLPLDNVLLATERGEAPVLGDNDLLPAGELVLGAAEGLEGDSAVLTSDVSRAS